MTTVQCTSVVECMTPGGGGGGGYSDICKHTYVRVIFFVQNFDFQYFWGFSEKINIFCGV